MTAAERALLLAVASYVVMTDGYTSLGLVSRQRKRVREAMEAVEHEAYEDAPDEVARGPMKDKEIPPITIRDIQHAVCDVWGLTLPMLRGPQRTRAIARPRQVAMWLACTLTGASLGTIGHAFRRDHTTVMHARRWVPRLMERDAEFAAEAGAVQERLRRPTTSSSPSADGVAGQGTAL